MKKMAMRWMLWCIFLVSGGVGFLKVRPQVEHVWAVAMEFVNPFGFDDYLKKKWDSKPTDFLISKLGHPAIAYDGVSTELLARRKDLDRENELIGIVQSGADQKKRSSALSVLFAWDKDEATKIAKEILSAGKKHPLYNRAISHLVHEKDEFVYPFILDLAKSPDRFTNGAVSYLREYGSRQALLVLEDMLREQNLSAVHKI